MRYIIGIDLGTTNCALSYIDATPGEDADEGAQVQQFGIPQLTNPGEVRDESLLPSFLYMPGPSDFPQGSLALPWNETPVAFAGQLAQKRGLEAALRSGFKRTKVAAIGPVVAAELTSAHISVDAMPEESYSMKPLVTSVCELLGGAR